MIQPKQTLRQRLKVNQTLGQTSQEEVQQLSQAAGRPPPTSPLEGKVIGANPDQAKMLGTQAQKTSALRIGITGQQSLSDTLRREQPRDIATAEEQKKLEKAEGFKGLGGLDDRVQALVEQKKQQVFQAQTKPLIADLAASIPPELREQLAPELEKLRNNPNDTAALIAISKAVGITEAKDIGSLSAKIKEQFSSTEQAAEVAGQAFDSNLKVADLDIQSLGFNDLTELATLLGMDPAELAEFNPNQLIDTIQAEIQDEFSAADALRAKLDDPTIGAAERAEARKQLREMGATGIKVAESDLDKLADEIENADTVMFNGEEIEVGELLDDEYMSGLAAAYYSDLTGEFADKLRTEEPEFVKWLDSNRTALEQSVSQLDSAIQQFATANLENQRLTAPETGLTDEIIQTLFPTYGELTGETYPVEDYYTLSSLVNPGTIPEPERKMLLGNVLKLYEQSPESVRQLLSMDRNQLIRSGALDGGDRFANKLSYIDTAARLNQADPADSYSIINAIFPGKSPEEAEAFVKETILRIRSNMFGDVPYKKELFNLLDRNGNLKTGQELLDAAKALNPDQTLSDLLNKPELSLRDKLSRIGTDFNGKADPTSGTFEKIKPYLESSSRGGSSLSRGEVYDLVRDLPDGTDVSVLYNELSKAGLITDEKARNEMTSAYIKKSSFTEDRNKELEGADKYQDGIKSMSDLTTKFMPFMNDIQRLLNQPVTLMTQANINRNVAHLNSHLKPFREHLVDIQKRAASARGVEKLALLRHSKELEKILDRLNPSMYSDKIAQLPKATITMGVPIPAQAPKPVSKQEDEKAKSSAAREQIVDKNSPLPKGVTVIDTTRYQGAYLQRLSNGTYRRIPG